jgi:hypothetical protein
MAMDTKLKSGVDYLPSYNWAPGMNDDLAYADRAGYNTSVPMLTTGEPRDWNDFGSLEVGGMYDMDPMGEMRDDATFSETDPVAMGSIGKLGTEASGMQDGAVSEVGPGSKKMNLSPQTYNSVGLSKKAG